MNAETEIRATLGDLVIANISLKHEVAELKRQLAELQEKHKEDDTEPDL